MTPDDRYQVVSADGLIVAVSTRAQAFRIGEKYAHANPGACVEVFDVMARHGQADTWQYIMPGAGWPLWVVVGVRLGPV